MAAKKPQASDYVTLRLDTDLEDRGNDSDTTLGSSTVLKSDSARSPSPKSRLQKRLEAAYRKQNLFTWLRWGLVVFLQCIIIILLLPGSGLMGSTKWDESMTETGGDINGLYIPTKHKWMNLLQQESKYIPNMDSDADRMEIRKNWDKLMPLGSGTVNIPEHLNYPKIGKPINDDPTHTGPIYEAAWTHALHCLYYTLDSYHQLTVSNGTKFGFDGKRNDYHAGHCFEYLRNQIMCMSDMTLEGSASALGATGDGQAHMCRDQEEAIRWIEGRRLDDFQSIVGPEE
ncbi:hypothetical protein HYFRA_00010573 [Hymenoscyphus fraxineus]|uniref:Uncharacterized protein n=1 Tax=Hymenoscyphus fraxineus TaxID=746836 RepID=A0A9N9PY72_9HELO|nr:hypothetical protein HYFRA_00010573 [Hymenoscyphus fraxineus]